MSTFLCFLFLLSILVILYVYFGYPCLLGLWAVFRHPEIHKADITPLITVLIAAYNEEEVIAEKLQNFIASAYPKERLEIVVVSDGSNDRTDEIVSSFPQVKLLSLPRRGKLYALEDGVKIARGEIFVFTDADVQVARDSLLQLMKPFADPAVGGVAGNRISRSSVDSESSSKGERWYGEYDKRLKQLETRSGSTVSADGALYAIRRECYRKIDQPDVTDDFAISTAVILAGRRLVFEGAARCFETTVPTSQQEFGRKTRLMTRGLGSLMYRKALLNPFRHGFYSVKLFSHKVLRRLVPVFLILAFCSNLLLWNEGSHFRLMLLAQVIFYLTAILGYFLRKTALGRLKILLAPFFFSLGNLAALVALSRLCTGRKIESWEPQRTRAERR